MSGAVLLSVRDLRVAYAIRRQRVLTALDGVGFDLGAGETLGVVGESGCGKSSLARAVLGLVQPAAGELRWRGEPLAAAPRGAMQCVFQDPLDALDPRMTVGESIAEPLRYLRADLNRAERARRVRAALADVGLLPEHAHRFPHEFSGGQCQRVGIARALVCEPELIVCDEPVSALDVSIQAQILNLLMDLREQRGLALLFVSHDLNVVRHIAQCVLVLYLGRVMEVAPVDVVFRQPAHPYTRALLDAIPGRRGGACSGLGGELPSPLDPPSGCVFRTRCPRARPVCGEVRPTLGAIGAGHSVACHFPESDGL